MLTFATPRVQDILFYETEKTTKGSFGRYGKDIPAYNTPHYDSKNWPNHKFVFAQPEQTDGQLMRFYYAADRESQDDYNYELRDGQELIRTYVIPRDEYDTVDFTIPDGGTLDTLFTDYAFAGDSIVTLDEPLASLYIAVQRRYIKASIEEEIYDASLEAVVTVTKEVKPSGYKLADDALENSAGTVYEVRHGNNYHDILVTRELSAADKADRQLTTIYGAQKYEALPPRLDSVDLVYRSAWVTRITMAGNTAQFSEDFFVDFDVTPPSSGPFKTIIERWVTQDPDTILDTILSGATLLPKVKEEDLSVAYAAWSTSPPMARAVARQYRIPASFHGEIEVTVNGTDNGADRTPLTVDRVIWPDPVLAHPTGFTTDLSGIYTIDVGVEKVALDMFLVTHIKLDLTDGIYD